MINHINKQKIYSLFDDLSVVYSYREAKSELKQIILQDPTFYEISKEDVLTIDAEIDELLPRITLHQRIGANKLFGIIPPSEE